MPLNKWKTKLDFEEIRKNDSALMNLLNEKQNPLNYNLFVEKTSNFCRNILNKIIYIHSLFNDQQNKKLENLKKDLECNFIIEPPIDDLSNVISEELDLFIQYLKNKDRGKDIDKDKNKDKNKDKKEIQQKKGVESVPYKNEITFTYYLDPIFTQANIFGYTFLNNNKDNIDILINGEKTDKKSYFNLEPGYNELKMIIKNKITDLSYLFNDERDGLRNIDELKYLDTSNVTNFSHVFNYFSKLSDITPLSNWNVSKGINFSYMFYECSSLSNIEPLENWDVSNGTNFEQMFTGCERLKNLQPLKNWNVSNSNNFSRMFKNCKQITNVTPLENWNVSNAKDLSELFCHCSISNLKPLQNWDVGNCQNFKGMFYLCQFNSVKPLENWNISNGKNFVGMLYQSAICPDLKPIMKWKKEEIKKMRKEYKVEIY